VLLDLGHAADCEQAIAASLSRFHIRIGTAGSLPRSGLAQYVFCDPNSCGVKAAVHRKLRLPIRNVRFWQLQSGRPAFENNISEDFQ
jgi:hypothetical protein